MAMLDRLITRATEIVPAGVRARIARTLGSGVRSPSFSFLSSLMDRYRTDRLIGASPTEFRDRIEQFLALRDHAMEGYDSPERQRDMSVRFRWGHDHDFGSFRLTGAMGVRHLSMLATFMDRFGALPRDLTGVRVLDIGCWTGGTSLVLAAMGAEVVAIDEVRKYVECVRYLRDSFGVGHLDPRHLSLYECVGAEFDDAFDVVLFAGVLYHLTDPVLGLRITFDCLRPGGVVLLETAMSYARGSVCRYEGPERVSEGRGDGQLRAGWNWFVPSRDATRQMMQDVGYGGVVVKPSLAGRAFAVGHKRGHVDMLRAGLSRPSVR